MKMLIQKEKDFYWRNDFDVKSSKMIKLKGQPYYNWDERSLKLVWVYRTHGKFGNI